SKATNVQLKLGNTNQLNNISKRLTTISNSFNKLNSNLKSTRTSIAALNSSFNKAASSVNAVAKSQSNLTTQAGRANASLKQQSGLLGSLAGRFGSVAKQAIAFGLISRPIYDLQRALTQSVKAAVAFEKEIVKISQVTGQSVSQLSNLTKQISQLSTSLGVGANELAETARIIAQTGKTAQQTETILKALARSTLAPTFGKITDTTEGLIAALAQFNLKASDSEAVLGSLNKISKNFAVESEDLISAIRRTGGVFAQAAGQSKGTVAALQELSAIFTAVRSTTRESADTIAAGLRTIFSRIQRRGTIEFLKQFNVELTDAKGNFVGVFPAFDQLSKRLDTLIKQGDALTLSAIAEELGGIRQIGKLLPAIAQFDKARKALEDAQKGAVEGLGVDVAKGLNTIDNRLKRVRESFNQLIRTVFESDSFQNFTKNILTAAENFLKFGNSITKAIEPILPLLTTLGAFKIGAGISGLLRGGGGAVSTVTGQASATANKQTASAAQKTAAATTTQNNLITNTNKILTNILNQVSNLSSNNSSGFNKVVSAINSRPIGGAIPGRRRAGGGSIPKFANGGRVYGPSHAAGGVIAELEGGEYVVPKKYAKGYNVGETVKAPSASLVRQELKAISKTKGFVPIPGGAVATDIDGGQLKVAEARALSKADKNQYAGVFLKPEGAQATFEGTNSLTELENELKKSPVYKELVGSVGPTAKNFKEKTKGIKGASRIQGIAQKYLNKNVFQLGTGSLGQAQADKLEDTILRGVIATVKSSSQQISKQLGFSNDPQTVARALKSANIDQVVGNIFESVLSFAGVPFGGGDTDPPNAPLDFPKGLTANVAKQFGTTVPPGVPTESKTTFTQRALSQFNRKISNFNLEEAKNELLSVFAQFRGKGGVSGESIKKITGAKTNADAVAALNSRGIGVAESKVGNRTSFALTPRKAAGGVISKFQTGGEVPVRISNGEMVVSDPREVAANKGSLQKINKLAAGGFASGYVAQGPGTGTSDSIYTTLPAGAFVVNAASTKKFLGRARGGGIPKVQALQFGGTSRADLRAGLGAAQADLRFAQGRGDSAGIAKAEQQVKLFTKALAKAEKNTIKQAKAEEKATRAGKKLEQSFLAAEKSARRAAQKGTLAGPVAGVKGPRAKSGVDPLGAVFALSALSSTVGEADSALGEFVQGLTTALFTLTALGPLLGGLPGGGLGGLAGQIGASGALGGGVRKAAVGKQAAALLAADPDLTKAAALRQASAGSTLGVVGGGVGAAALGLGAAVGGGFAGRFAGQQIGNLAFGKEQKVGSIAGSIDAETARSRQKTTQVATAVGAGAGIGAAVGLLVPVIGPPIGAAIGAGIGLVVGALVPPIGAEAQQAAFEIAKDLKDSGKAIRDSLVALNKDFNSISFGEFTDTLTDQTSDIKRDLPRLVQNLEDSFAFRGRRKAQVDVARSFGDIIKPEELQQREAAVTKGFEQLFAKIADQDLGNLLEVQDAEGVSNALRQAADAGNLFAEDVLKAADNLSTQRALAKASQLAQNDRTEQEKKTAILLQNVAAQFDFVTGSADELEKAIDRVAQQENIKGAELRFARDRVREFAQEQKDGVTQQVETLAKQTQLNRTLTESAQVVNSFNIAVRESINGLSQSLARSGETFDLFAQRVADIESGSGAVRLDTGLGNRGNDEVIAILEKSTGQNLDAFRNIENLQSQLPNVVKNAVESIPATAGTEQTTDALVNAIQQQTGLQITGDFRKGLGDTIRGLISSRQEGGDSILGGAALKELFEKGEIDKLLGDVVKTQLETFGEIKKQAEVLRKQFEKRINFEVSRLQRVQAFEQKIFEKRLGNEQLINSILGKNANTIEQSLNVLQRRIQSTAGSSDLGGLLAQRGEALARKQQLEQQIELGDTSAATANELIRLADQFARADQALKKFTEDTSFAAAVQAEAAQAQQRISTSAAALDSLISGAQSREGTQEIVSSVNTLQRVLAGRGSTQDLLQVFSSGDSPILKAITESRLGEGGAETLQGALRFQLAQQLQGTPLGGIANDLLASISDDNRDLATLAQRANNFAEQQVTVLRSIESQNAAAISTAQSGTDPFSQSVNTFSTAVQKFATTVASGGGGVFAGGAPVARAAGGVIYRNQGGFSDSTLVGAFTNRFSQGTDTIPAMLSPGEYVVRASAVRNVGVGTLDAINSGSVNTASTGGVIYRQGGGLTDVVQTNVRKLSLSDVYENLYPALQPFNRKDSSGFGRLLSAVTGGQDNPLGNVGSYPGLPSIAQNVGFKIIQDDLKTLLFNTNLKPDLKAGNKTLLEAFANAIGVNPTVQGYDPNSLLQSVAFNNAQQALNALGEASRGIPSTKLQQALAKGSAPNGNFVDGTGGLVATVGRPRGFELINAINNSRLEATQRKKRYGPALIDLISKLDQEALKEAAQRTPDQELQGIRSINQGIYGNLIKQLQTASSKSSDLLTRFQGLNPDLLSIVSKQKSNEGVLGAINDLTFDEYKNIQAGSENNKLNLFNTKIKGGNILDGLLRLNEDGFNQLAAFRFGGNNFIDDLFQNINLFKKSINGTGVLSEILKFGDLFAGNDAYKQAVSEDNLAQALIKGAKVISAGSGIEPNSIVKGQSNIETFINATEFFQSIFNKKVSSLLGAKAAEAGPEYLAGLPDERLQDHFTEDPFDGTRTNQIEIGGTPVPDVTVQQEIDRRALVEREKRADTPQGRRRRRIQERQARQQEAKLKRLQASEEKFAKLQQEDDTLANLSQKLTSLQDLRSGLKGQVDSGELSPEAASKKLNLYSSLITKFSILRARRTENLRRKAGFGPENNLFNLLTDQEKDFARNYNFLIQAGLGGNVDAFGKAAQLGQQFAQANTPNQALIFDKIRQAQAILFGPNKDRPQTFHTGGLVGSYSQGGNVPIMAQAGEYVMSRKAVRQNGLGVLNAMNGGVVHKQEGGFLGRRSGGVLNRNISVSLDASNASALLQDSILNAGSSVNQLWSQTFTTFMEQFTQAVTPIQG
ncbi:MAG: phage tail tape measure protein, partial [Candidatus Hodarchaeales archaeon]